MPPNTQFEQISVGFYHTCAIDTVGIAWCWGSSFYGNDILGADHFDSYNAFIPEQVTMPTDATFVEISAGVYHTCALDSNHHVWCWGYNDDYQLGTGNQTSTSTPVAVVDPSNNSFIKISTGGYYSCALNENGRIWCWGNNDNSIQGTNYTLGIPHPINDPL
jgi:alpha-tubulin suppressor-like RCC1 family protein